MSIFRHPSWILSSNIYEVNIRQYTPEGSLNAFAQHLPRLADMGVEILWLMPVTPISEKGRKGSLGSYYAAQDYTSVNSEFGSLQDMVLLIVAAHELGLKVIIDWVANHTGNDHVWIKEHPTFFCYDDSGAIIHPHGWEDVSKLNFDNRQMRDAMIEAMRFWITETGIDGFRCDMAHLVTLDFWKEARESLETSKAGLFWLAECEEPFYHEVFDASYTWKWMHATEKFIKNEESFDGVLKVLNEYKNFPADALRVYFTSNHDENSWNGTEYEKYGDAALPFAVFTCTWNGLLMIYSGQELPNHKRLQFFDKDEISWVGECKLHQFYKILLQLRKSNPALCAGDEDINTEIIFDDNEPRVFGYVRRSGESTVITCLNFTSEKKKISIPVAGVFKNIFSETIADLGADNVIQMEGWGFVVLSGGGKPRPYMVAVNLIC